MNFDKWDRIFMTNQQCLDLTNLLPDPNDREGAMALADYDMYPLHRFVLTVPNGNFDDPEGKKTGSVFHHCFTMIGDRLDVRTLVENSEHDVAEAFTFSIDLIKFIIIKKDGLAVEKLDAVLFGKLPYWTWLMFEFMLINRYILSDPEKTVNIEEKEVKRHSSGKTVSKRQQNKVRLVRRYKLKRGWKGAVRKQIHEIKCAAWGVRGHVRHYKTGKTIFIQPYVKGKKRNEYQGKVYELFAK